MLKHIAMAHINLLEARVFSWKWSRSKQRRTRREFRQKRNTRVYIEGNEFRDVTLGVTKRGKGSLWRGSGAYVLFGEMPPVVGQMPEAVHVGRRKKQPDEIDRVRFELRQYGGVFVFCQVRTVEFERNVALLRIQFVPIHLENKTYEQLPIHRTAEWNRAEYLFTRRRRVISVLNNLVGVVTTFRTEYMAAIYHAVVNNWLITIRGTFFIANRYWSSLIRCIYTREWWRDFHYSCTYVIDR